MSTENVAAYLLVGGVLVLLIATWARAWGRSAVRWGAIALVATPFGFWIVVLALLVRGRQR